MPCRACTISLDWLRCSSRALLIQIENHKVREEIWSKLVAFAAHWRIDVTWGSGAARTSPCTFVETLETAQPEKRRSKRETRAV